MAPVAIRGLFGSGEFRGRTLDDLTIFVSSDYLLALLPIPELRGEGRALHDVLREEVLVDP